VKTIKDQNKYLLIDYLTSEFFLMAHCLGKQS